MLSHATRSQDKKVKWRKTQTNKEEQKNYQSADCANSVVTLTSALGLHFPKGNSQLLLKTLPQITTLLVTLKSLKIASILAIYSVLILVLALTV